MKTIGGAIGLLFLLTFGSLWGLGYLAFGNAKCSGINPFALSVLGILLVITIFVIFSGLDWINDYLATRSVTKAQAQTNKNLTEQARTVVAQLAAQRQLSREPEGNSGGLLFEDGDFEEYPR